MNFKFKNEFEKNIYTIIPHFNETEKNKISLNKGEIRLEEKENALFINIGLGKREKTNIDIIRNVYKSVVRFLEKRKIENVNLDLFETEGITKTEVLQTIMETFLQFTYEFDKYKNVKKFRVKEVNILKNDSFKYLNLLVKESKIVQEARDIAKDLVNEPSNKMNPKILAKECEKLSKKFGFDIEVFDEKYIVKNNMNAYYAVAAGASIPPRLIVMKYNNNPESKEIISLVGKGLTYDSGGYSLKTSAGMMTMKTDMGGAAAVIGAMCAIAKKELKINVVAIVAACENLIGENSIKPGDIVESMNGKTIEILNTDAEGRLTLADAITYAIRKENATKVLDIATLTGAVVAALGKNISGVLSNDDDFYNELNIASIESNEKIWRLPAEESYREKIKSDFADLKNIGGAHAGTITAGLFIEEFVENTSWIHMDIAGTAWSDSESDKENKGATGVGVKTLYNLIKNLSV